MTSSLTILDIDDTLFRTTTKVHVVRGEKRVRSLTAAEFNTYELQPGERFDFSEFRSASHFIATARPINTVFRTAKLMMDRLKGEHKRFIVVTARADFDDKHMFLATFRKYGFDIDRSHVYRAGNIPNASSHEAKKIIIRKEMAKKKYDIVRMFDDARKNLDSFLELNKEFPNTKFEAFLVHHDGTIARYT